jgi:Xaa-Pro dipeptidase
MRWAAIRASTRQFEKVKRHFEANPAITGAQLYAFACASAKVAGWKFGGKITGHIVAEFPHARPRLGSAVSNRI